MQGGLQKFHQPAGWQGPTEVIALHFVAAELLEDGDLLLSLDAFDGDAEVEIIGNPDNGLDDGK